MTDTTVTTDAVAPVRIDSANIDERVRAELLQIAGFSDLRAQDQALLCYRALGRYGVIAPSWTRVREIIGKGSSNSISQAQKIFLAELGKFLTSAREIDASVPRAVADSFAGLWRDAVDHARQAFDGQTRKWKDQILQAEAARDAAEQARAEVASREQSLLARIQGLDGIVKSLQEQLSTEKHNREQAERLLQHANNELIEQRNDLKQALAASQRETEAAITRLEGVQKHSLQEVARARSERDAEIARARSERDRLVAQLDEQRQALDTTSREIQALRLQLQAALQENSRLAEQIRTMAAEQTASPERRARHFRPLRRDRRRS